MWGEHERPGKQNPNHTPRLVSLSCSRFLNWAGLLSPELGQRTMFCVSQSSKMDFKSVSGRRWEPLTQGQAWMLQSTQEERSWAGVQELTCSI